MPCRGEQPARRFYSAGPSIRPRASADRMARDVRIRGQSAEPARMAEQVDAADLKSAGHCGCAGSTPAPGTTRQAGAVQLRIVCHASVVTSGGRRRRTAWIRECEGIDRKSSGQVQIPPARRSARNPNIQSTDRSQGMDARHRVEGIAWRAHLDHEGMQTYFRWSGQSGETSASEHGRRQANRC